MRLRAQQPTAHCPETAASASAYVTFAECSAAAQAAAELGGRVDELAAHGFGREIAVALAEEGLHGARQATTSGRDNAVEAIDGSGWQPAAFDEAGDPATAPVMEPRAEVPADSPGQAREPGELEQRGFVHDPVTGYLYDQASGYYYDATSGLYCHPSVGQWGSVDFATGSFTPYAPVEEEEARPADVGPAKRSAVIGAGPRLDAQALLEAARAQDITPLQSAAKSVKSQKKAPAAEQGPPASAEQAAAPRAVQGVVHRGKWAQRAPNPTPH